YVPSVRKSPATRSHRSWFTPSVPRPATAPPFPYTTLFRSRRHDAAGAGTVKNRYAKRSPAAGRKASRRGAFLCLIGQKTAGKLRSEEHTSELQSRFDLVCRLLLETQTSSSQSSLETHSVAP